MRSETYRSCSIPYVRNYLGRWLLTIAGNRRRKRIARNHEQVIHCGIRVACGRHEWSRKAESNSDRDPFQLRKWGQMRIACSSRKSTTLNMSASRSSCPSCLCGESFLPATTSHGRPCSGCRCLARDACWRIGCRHAYCRGKGRRMATAASPIFFVRAGLARMTVGHAMRLKACVGRRMAGPGLAEGSAAHAD